MQTINDQIDNFKIREKEYLERILEMHKEILKLQEKNKILKLTIYCILFILVIGLCLL